MLLLSTLRGRVAFTHANQRLQLRTELLVVGEHAFVLLLVVEVGTFDVAHAAFLLSCVLAKGVDDLRFLGLFEFLDDSGKAITTSLLLSLL